jgi:hypothetical protein
MEKKGKERKGKERKGKERKGKERKGRERLFTHILNRMTSKDILKIFLTVCNDASTSKNKSKGFP